MKLNLLSTLAAKITLPFVALFAALLLALGWILASEILTEVEARVENEQCFALEIAAFPGWPLGEESLRQIRARSTPRDSTSSTAAQSEFVVLQHGALPLSTFDKKDNASGQARLDTFLAELKKHPEWEGADNDNKVQRFRAELNGQDFLMLTTSRAPPAPGRVRNQFFLLYPYAEIERAKNQALWRIVWLGSAGLLAAAALGLALAHWIASPVVKLAAAAQRVATSGLNAPLEPSLFATSAVAGGGGEIGELSRGIRAMLDALRHSQAELVKAERLAATGKLAAGVAHEIRNPLTSMRMAVQMLQTKFAKSSGAADDATASEAFRIVLSEIDRLALAVEELLTFAKPHPPQKVPTNLNALAAETLRFMERQLAHAKVTATLEADANLPADVLLDPHKLKQLIYNLVLNAQQAVVRNGAVILRTKWDAVSHKAVMEVEDNGPGVPEAIRGRIFEVFVSTKPGGSGLGLAIAKQIVEEHGGAISFESAPGRTIFRAEFST